MSKKLTNRVTDILKDHDIIINKVERKKVGFFIDADNILVHVTKNCLSVAFHVSVRADDSAITALMLKDVTGAEVKIGDVYCVRTDGEHAYYVGDEAFENWELQKQNMVIQRYIQEKNLLEWFLKAENCGKA